MARGNSGNTTSIASTTTSTTLVTANNDNIGFTVTNTDANILYLLLGTGTASATNYSVAIPSNGYFESPFGYSGAATGVWSADGTGAALITVIR